MPWPKGGPAYDEEQAGTYSMDPERAQELISDAGATGATVQLVMRSDFADSISAGEIVRANLEQVGLRVEPLTLDGAAFGAMLQEGGNPGIAVGRLGVQPDLGASLSTTNALLADPEANQFNPFSNEAYAAATAATGDPLASDEARFGAVHDASDIMLDECFIVPITYEPAQLLGAPSC